MCAWWLYRKSHMLKYYFFFALHPLLFSLTKLIQTSLCFHIVFKGPLSCRYKNNKEWKGGDSLLVCK